MYLGVSIDSESHASINSICSNSMETVKKWAEEYDNADNAEISWEDNMCYIEDEDYFIVSQVFDVPAEAQYAVVFWHAYDGVDFTLIGTAKDKETALKQWYEEVAYRLSEWSYYDDDLERDITLDDIEYDGEFVGDAGSEWEMVYVIPLTNRR